MSGLKERINADLKSAMLARDAVKTQTLQGLKSAILYEEVAKKVRETGLDEAGIEQVIAREVKKRDEAAQLFEQGGKSEGAAKERAEKEILSVFLPEQLSEAEVQKLVEAAVAEVKPEGVKDMGRVIGAVKAKAGNTADGALVAKLVKESLQ
ncbi:MAG: GatB/YqeY domain-containing protein [Acidobacteriota bacterium]